jgi:hypothetical protein
MYKKCPHSSNCKAYLVPWHRKDSLFSHSIKLKQIIISIENALNRISFHVLIHLLPVFTDYRPSFQKCWGSFVTPAYRLKNTACSAINYPAALSSRIKCPPDFSTYDE